MKRTAEQTAILIALLQKRAGVKRARISEKTIRLLAKRKHLRVVFLAALKSELDDLGVHMLELGRRGFGIISSSSLAGAPSILAKRFLMDDLESLRSGNKTFDNFREEVDQDADEGQD